jgi:aryl-alcohol dehydrogenase-like predicted oxidoreductase
MTPPDLSRRDFVAMGAAGTAAAMLKTHSLAARPTTAMPERTLGKTGYRVKLFSLGGQATLEQAGTRDESVAIINRAIDLGVNYIDTAAAYGRGISQTYIGEVMTTRRDEVFLATKTHNRTRDGSLELLEDSLTKLQTDHLDLWQLHNISQTEQLDQIFGKDGAIEALLQARDEGIVRYLGITGHADPDVLIDGLNRFDFDTILMALNVADRHVDSFIDKLLPMANEKGLGIIGMKIPARGRMFREGGVTSMHDAMCYVLTLPVSTVIVGCDTVAQLEENIAIAQDFQPLAKARMAELERLAEPYARDAAFFRKSGARQRRG